MNSGSGQLPAEIAPGNRLLTAAEETVRKVGALSLRGTTCRIRNTGETGCGGQESLDGACPAQLACQAGA